jgi:excisionase family DNA binding protein
LTYRARASTQVSPSSPLSRLLTVQELADLLQVPPKTIYAWRYKRTGPTAVPVGKYLRFRPEDVAAWLEARAEPPRAEAKQVVARGGGNPNLKPARPRHRDSSTPADGWRTHSGSSSSS